jgi:hypothetical protein
VCNVNIYVLGTIQTAMCVIFLSMSCKEMFQLEQFITEEGKHIHSGHYKACVVAPHMGGIPHDGGCEITLVEGFSLTDALAVLSTHVGCVLSPEIDTICLDAFVPTDSARNSDQTKDSSTGQSVCNEIRW